MTSNPDPRPARKRARLRHRVAGVAAFVGVAVVSLVSVWLLATDARREIDKLAEANADSSQWSLAQLEVEFLTLQNALLSARGGTGSLDEVRRRFDIFYSRVQTVERSPSFAEVTAIAEVREALGAIEVFLEASVPRIDAEDAALQEALPAMVSDVRAPQAAVRQIALSGVDVFAEVAEAQRESVARALINLGEIAAMLLFGLLLVVGGLMYMTRASRRKNAQLALTQSRLQAIVSTSIDAILVADTDGRVIDYNGAAERIFGYSRSEAIGADLGALIIPDHMRAAHETGMKRYRETGVKHVVGSGLVHLEARRKDGTHFPVEFSINAVENEEGEIFVSFLRDISVRKQNERDLVKARDDAIAGEKAKANLLAVMSHEMRTPLNGVLGTLQLLQRTDLDTRQQGFVDVMETSGQTLLDHVNNVLDISRLDAGKATVSRRVFDLPALVTSVADSLRGQAGLRGNRLGVSTHGDLGAPVQGDEARLRQVLFNLLGNAIKFTRDGTIAVEVERDPGSDVVELRIIDSGIGIAEADLDRIFEDFVTLDASYQREAEGTGLGLGITRRLVTLMGGETGVESEVGDGSVFWVRLPLPAQVAPAVPQRAARPSLPADLQMSVLVVEDNEINRMVVREMLVQHGCEVAEARDGEEGVQAADAQAFDLILMDVSMPRMDGLTATRLIREGSGPNSATPIIALTAHALPADIARFRDNGIVDVLTKPLSAARLAAVLRDVGGARDGTGAAHAPAPRLPAGIDPGQAEMLLERGRQELREGLGRLRQLRATHGPLEEVRALAHKIAGTTAVMGWAETHQALQQIETASLEGRTEEIDRLLADLPEPGSRGGPDA